MMHRYVFYSFILKFHASLFCFVMHFQVLLSEMWTNLIFGSQRAETVGSRAGCKNHIYHQVGFSRRQKWG